MNDILGQALLDYQNGNYTEDILTETNISEEDVLPIPYLFRGFSEMPSIETKALELAKGKILNVGCGAGSHALYLQEKGFDVMAIDTSKGAIDVCKLRGINHAFHQDLLELKEETFDTILMLSNGTGIFQNIEQIDNYLQHLKTLLNPNGQVLLDSSDLQYMYDSTEEGAILVPNNRYYGELEFIMKYKNNSSEPFKWLYLDETIFETATANCGFKFKVIERGDNFDYLAKLFI